MVRVAFEIHLVNEQFGRFGAETVGVTVHEFDARDDVILLTLPDSLIARLGLESRVAWVEQTPGGEREVVRYGPVSVAHGDRGTTTECNRMPDGQLPILGRTTMMAMGLKVDEVSQELVLIPPPYLRI